MIDHHQGAFALSWKNKRDISILRAFFFLLALSFSLIVKAQGQDRIILPAELEIKLDKIIELEEQMIAANFSMLGFEGKQSLSEIREKKEEGTLTKEEAEAYVTKVVQIFEAAVIKVMVRDNDYDGDWSYESIRDHLIGPEEQTPEGSEESEMVNEDERSEILADEAFIQAVYDTDPLREINISGVPNDVLRNWRATWYAFGQQSTLLWIQVKFYFEWIGMDEVHLALDAAGFIPVIGELADGTNALLYVSEGEYAMATFSAIALVPVAGDIVGKGLKYALKGVEKVNPQAARAATEILSRASSSDLILFFGKLKTIPQKALQRFFQDIIQFPRLLESILINPNLVDGWNIVREGSETLRTNPENLEKISRFIKETGMKESNLIGTFKNVKNPQKWVDMKISEADLDVVYDGFKNSPLTKFEAWTQEHKAQRWVNYKTGNPETDFNTWSNKYDGNIDKAIAANKGVDNYYSGLTGKVVREKSFTNLSINTPEGVQSFTRRLDIVDEDAFKGIEFKEYSSGKVYRSPDIKREYLLDAELLDLELLDEIEWVFKGCEPSGPLKVDLEALGIKVILLP